MKRKALISVVLSMSLVLGMTGCSSGNTKETEAAGTTTSSETAATSTAETTSEKVSEPVTVSFYSPLPTIQEQYDSAASRYKDATGNDVEMTLIYNESYKDKLKVSMASNSAPDIFAHWSGGPMNSYIQEDLIIDLTP